MKPEIKEQSFVIARNLLNDKESEILSLDAEKFSLENFLDKEADRFIGRGFEINKSRLAEDASEEDRALFEIDFDGKPTMFEVDDYIFDFPVIEGELAPGIYNEYPDEFFAFYEVRDLLSLTKFANHTMEFEFSENKYLCQPDKIIFTSLDGTKPQYCFFRYPLTYFDVYCPFCNQKVFTYQTNKDKDNIDAAAEIECKLIEVPCTHFVDLIVLEGSSYDKVALDNMNRKYTYKNNELFVETNDKRWEKPHVHLMLGDKKDSYWNNKSKDDFYVNHFLFLPDE